MYFGLTRERENIRRGLFLSKDQREAMDRTSAGTICKREEKNQLSTKLKNIHIYECAFLQ